MGCIFVVGEEKIQLISYEFVPEVVLIVSTMFWGDFFHVSNMLNLYGFMVSVGLCVGMYRL
jgi:hypothetical protein